MAETEEQSKVETAPETHELKSMSLHAALGVCLLGWVVPGVAHLVLGRWGRALALGAAVLTMFGLGLAMDGRLYPAQPEAWLHIFAFLANVGVGASYFVAQNAGLGEGVLSSPSYDYGSTYLWVAGLLNYLIVLDGYDVARGRKP